jgi:DNA-binding transcriptional LysR family regulator
LNLSQLRFVRAVADAGTFTGGAARCYVTQSTLSTAIAHLEKELGERLFTRTTRSVSLTPFGHKLLPLIDEVLRAQDALVTAADAFLDPQSQLVRIGVCPLVESGRLERILAPFRTANRNVRIVLDQMGGGHARHALEEGRLDFVLGPVYPGRRSRVERTRLYDDPLVYLRAGEGPSGPLSGMTAPEASHRNPVNLQQIVDDVFLLVHDACGLTRLTRQLFASRRLTLKEYEGRAVSYQVLEEWTRVGVGSAILPESKLSAPGLGHPILLGNGHRATIRFEAVWLPATAMAPHLHALTRHLTSAGAALAQKEHS